MEFLLERCTLRDWREGDEASLAYHANNPNVARHLRELFPSPYTTDDAKEWIQRNLWVELQTQFAITIRSAAVGGIGLVLQADVYRHSAEIGYWLGEEFWGRGVMPEAVAAVTRYGLETLGRAHIYASVFENNLASARVLERAGYQLEGRLRRHVTKRGVTMDELLYGIVPA